jgi:hypothetical protein
MKSVKQIAIASLLAIGTIGATGLTSCTKSDDTKTCPVGYEGTDCATKAILGNWSGSDVCDSATYNNITIGINTASSDTNSVLVSNPGGFGSSVVVTGTLSSDATTVTLTNQDLGGNRKINGTIKLNSNTNFTFTYTVMGTIDNDHCSGTYTKL